MMNIQSDIAVLETARGARPGLQILMAGQPDLKGIVAAERTFFNLQDA